MFTQTKVASVVSKVLAQRELSSYDLGVRSVLEKRSAWHSNIFRNFAHGAGKVGNRWGELLKGSRIPKLTNAGEKLDLQNALNPAHAGTRRAADKVRGNLLAEQNKVLGTRLGTGGALVGGGYMMGSGGASDPMSA